MSSAASASDGIRRTAQSYPHARHADRVASARTVRTVSSDMQRGHAREVQLLVKAVIMSPQKTTTARSRIADVRVSYVFLAGATVSTPLMSDQRC
jgi:hypothetical protein